MTNFVLSIQILAQHVHVSMKGVSCASRKFKYYEMSVKEEQKEMIIFLWNLFPYFKILYTY